MADTDRNFHSFNDVHALYELASKFATSASSSSTLNTNPTFDNGVSGDFAPCRWFYRNKSPDYFSKIFNRYHGIMQVEPKDASGDPGSPINKRVSGMFFLASVDRGSKTGKPIRKSPFGSCRLLVPVSDLLGKAFSLYFTDFYCMTNSGYHYVTLVITVPGSTADQFCANSLLEVFLDGNPFLVMDESSQMHVTTKERLIVEVFYTENLDIRSYHREYDIPLVGKGSSTTGGIPKNRYCTICNL